MNGKRKKNVYSFFFFPNQNYIGAVRRFNYFCFSNSILIFFGKLKTSKSRDSLNHCRVKVNIHALLFSKGKEEVFKLKKRRITIWNAFCLAWRRLLFPDWDNS